MTSKYEYMIVRAEGPDKQLSTDNSDSTLVKMLNHFGEKGWRPVTGTISSKVNGVHKVLLVKER